MNNYYVLNSAVITGPGRYTYRLLTAPEARSWLLLYRESMQSRVGYESTRAFIQETLGADLPLSREESHLEPGDEALVVRLKYRVRPDQKAAGPQQVQPQPEDFELGLLRREDTDQVSYAADDAPAPPVRGPTL